MFNEKSRKNGGSNLTAHPPIYDACDKQDEVESLLKNLRKEPTNAVKSEKSSMRSGKYSMNILKN